MTRLKTSKLCVLDRTISLQYVSDIIRVRHQQPLAQGDADHVKRADSASTALTDLPREISVTSRRQGTNLHPAIVLQHNHSGRRGSVHTLFDTASPWISSPQTLAGPASPQGLARSMSRPPRYDLLQTSSVQRQE